MSEALKRDFGDSRGYDEQSTLLFLGDTLEHLYAERKDPRIYFIIKLHPENKRQEFEWVFSRWPSLEKSIIRKELFPLETVAISDLVVGMASILLMEALLANKPVLSLQLNSLAGSQLIATKVGAIPFVRTQNEGRQILNSLLQDAGYKKEYLKKQKRWKVNKNSTQKCFNTLKEIIDSRCFVMQ